MVKSETERTRDARRRLTGFAREMRHKPTETERKFWRMVRGRRFEGHKFKRQVPIGNYIADFACLERRLIVEIDGGEHETNKKYDHERDAALNALGFRVERFENWLVNADIEAVLEIVKAALDDTTPSPRPSPPLRGGEGD